MIKDLKKGTYGNLKKTNFGVIVVNNIFLTKSLELIILGNIKYKIIVKDVGKMGDVLNPKRPFLFSIPNHAQYHSFDG